ncbi:MAG: CPBP family intramembrane glutamic endopeptidase [Verrucomicrobiales bacterium]
MPDPAPQNFARSDAFKLTVWFLATAFLGAFLAPVIHVVGTAIVAGGHLEGGPADWVHSEMVKAEFGRYFNRAILMAALLLLYPMSRWLGLESGWGWMGLRPNPYRWKDLGLGFFLAAGSLLVVALVYLQLGWYRLREPMPSVPGVLGGAVFTGFSVAVLEECLFRGLLFGILLRSLSERTSLWFLSAFFALLHFLKPPEGGGTLENVDWLAVSPCSGGSRCSFRILGSLRQSLPRSLRLAGSLVMPGSAVLPSGFPSGSMRDGFSESKLSVLSRGGRSGPSASGLGQGKTSGSVSSPRAGHLGGGGGLGIPQA